GVDHYGFHLGITRGFRKAAGEVEQGERPGGLHSQIEQRWSVSARLGDRSLQIVDGDDGFLGGDSGKRQENGGEKRAHGGFSYHSRRLAAIPPESDFRQLGSRDRSLPA